jgi:hypothetical protein
VGRVSSEARARLAGEADLIRRHQAEWDRLLKSRDRKSAIVALVDKHKIEYGEIVTAHRARFEANRAVA